MANPRIEEVEDEVEDPEEMDLDAFDFSRPQQGSLQPSMDPAASQMSPEDIQAMLQPQDQQSSGNARSQVPQQMSEKERERIFREQREKTKNYQCIYPIYFDALRSREDGRRVKKEDAVQNPLARDIVEALQHIGNSMGVGLQLVFEPSKTHPKDWANPGRVKVLVKKDGRPISAKIQNSMQMAL